MLKGLEDLTELIIKEGKLLDKNTETPIELINYVDSQILHDFSKTKTLEIPNNANAYIYGKPEFVRMARYGTVIDINIQPITYLTIKTD